MTGERLQSVLQQDSAEIEGRYRLNDSLFKYLVGSGGGEEVLMGFLNSVMDGSRQILALEYLDRERSPLYVEKSTPLRRPRPRRSGQDVPRRGSGLQREVLL